MTDNINHPTHHTSRNIGYECIILAKHQYFCTGNTIKYLWRHKDKETPIEDLKKARWYARKPPRDTNGRKPPVGCGIILRNLIQSTTGLERIAWHGIRTSDWHKAIETLNRMMEKENE